MHQNRSVGLFVKIKMLKMLKTFRDFNDSEYKSLALADDWTFVFLINLAKSTKKTFPSNLTLYSAPNSQLASGS